MARPRPFADGAVTSEEAGLRKQAAPEHQAHILMLTDFLPEMAGQDIPDPYFGPVAGFDAVIGMIERAAIRLLSESREGRLRLG